MDRMRVGALLVLTCAHTLPDARRAAELYYEREPDRLKLGDPRGEQFITQSWSDDDEVQVYHSDYILAQWVTSSTPWNVYHAAVSFLNLRTGETAALDWTLEHSTALSNILAPVFPNMTTLDIVNGLITGRTPRVWKNRGYVSFEDGIPTSFTSHTLLGQGPGKAVKELVRFAEHEFRHTETIFQPMEFARRDKREVVQSKMCHDFVVLALDFLAQRGFKFAPEQITYRDHCTVYAAEVLPTTLTRLVPDTVHMAEAWAGAAGRRVLRLWRAARRAAPAITRYAEAAATAGVQQASKWAEAVELDRAAWTGAARESCAEEDCGLGGPVDPATGYPFHRVDRQTLLSIVRQIDYGALWPSAFLANFPAREYFRYLRLFAGHLDAVMDSIDNARALFVVVARLGVHLYAPRHYGDVEYTRAKLEPPFAQYCYFRVPVPPTTVDLWEDESLCGLAPMPATANVTLSWSELAIGIENRLDVGNEDTQWMWGVLLAVAVSTAPRQ